MNDEMLKKLSKMAEESSLIQEELYDLYNVKRGLRNKDHTGVLVGLTHIGDVQGYDKSNGDVKPRHGRLLYRGIDIKDIVKGFLDEKRFGFDETVFLLLFGKLPAKEELDVFSNALAEMRDLPENFIEDMILKIKGKDIMNMLARCVLALYPIDENADDTTTLNILKQSMNLIAKFPSIIAYSYQSMRHMYKRETLAIRHPGKELSTAENFLYMLKGKDRYTALEAELLDLCLVLHAEHGGGNNSSFTMHVVSSSGTDTYSAVAAALGSLKGPLHGGANIRVMEMMENIKSNVKDWKNDDEIKEYLLRILGKNAFDGSGKIYGFGHAVYTRSDPRAVLLKERAAELAEEKNKIEEFELYERIEKIAPAIFSEFKKDTKIISANVDYYSGFVYSCLDIPKEVYTPLFAMARIAGWCAHRLEELISARRIIRPAYKNVVNQTEYIEIGERQ
ncbi:citrate/2-methylcitrate synthase [Candidatus Woesearchaeota archaeon]|nr:citrate/2-methylcitrate synthase [Candidatus Woesearchaeota archaeon]